MPMWLVAGGWGLIAGSALLLGAALGYFARIPQRLIASIMGFGAGVLISVLSFDLMEEAYEQGGFDSSAIGFLFGAALYSAANWSLAHRGAKHRKRSSDDQPTEEEHSGSGLAIAIGSLLDGIPESIVIGTTLIGGGAVSIVAVIGIFLSNLPEGLSSSAGMKRANRSPIYVFGLWGTIAFVSGLSALAGYAVFSRVSDEIVAATTATAAGAVLAMLTDTMLPEAVEEAHSLIGLVAVLGFIAAFALTKLV